MDAGNGPVAWYNSGRNFPARNSPSIGVFARVDVSFVLEGSWR